MTRFERKILFAILVVTLVPLVFGIVLGRPALEETYAVGVNPELRAQLEEGLEVRRRYLALLRTNADHTADAIAYDWRVRAAVDENDRAKLRDHLEASLNAHPNVAGIAVRHGDETFVAVSREVAEGQRTSLRERTIPDVSGVPITIELQVTAPRAPFDEFQLAGERVGLYSRLQEQSTYVAGVFAWVYLGLLVAVMILAAIAAIVLSRRVTRRVAALATATREVGRGDLSVRVPVVADDEVAELTASFNAMVEDLDRSQRRIEYLQRVSAWQQFARRLAHEIKNPLTPIQLAAQELDRSYRGDDPRYRRKLSDATEIIGEEVATLRRLVSEFSDFAKLPTATLSRANLSDFVDDLRKSAPMILADLELDNVAIEFGEKPTNAIPVRIDAMMLKRCTDNLIRNAAQAIRDTGRGGTVRVSLEASDVAVLIVEDDGPGIPDEQRHAIFDPYLTTKTDGTGLGLAIVKKVVLEHGGEIRCTARPDGEGARFEIELPLLS